MCELIFSLSRVIEKDDEYISLTDIARFRDADRSDYILQNWMRNRSTIEFIGLWELFNNPDFNSIEFEGIKNLVGMVELLRIMILRLNLPHG